MWIPLEDQFLDLQLQKEDIHTAEKTQTTFLLHLPVNFITPTEAL